jgi:predicted metal-dependent hydrolase
MTLTLPNRMKESLVESFLLEKSDWIMAKLRHIFSFSGKYDRILATGKRSHYLEYRKQAEEYIKTKLENFNQFYGFHFEAISIRNQRTRWGSCSRKGNLNFNYKLLFLPEHMADYVIVHELCHLGEFNHSRRFWNLVAKKIPDYKNIVREMRGL